MVLTLYMMYISPPCRAVLMTLKHLELPVDIKLVNSIQTDLDTSPQFSKINPRKCVPTLDDDGFHLWESRAIMTYLVNKYSPKSSLYPKDPKHRALVDKMLYFDQGTLYKSQVEYLYPIVFHGEMPDEEKESNYRSALLLLDEALAQNAFVAGGDLTLADLSIAANVSLADAYNYNFQPFYNLRQWLKVLKESLPYYKEVNEDPLFQFKFCFGVNFAFEDDEAITRM